MTLWLEFPGKLRLLHPWDCPRKRKSSLSIPLGSRRCHWPLGTPDPTAVENQDSSGKTGGWPGDWFWKGPGWIGSGLWIPALLQPLEQGAAAIPPSDRSGCWDLMFHGIVERGGRSKSRGGGSKSRGGGSKSRGGRSKSRVKDPNPEVEVPNPEVEVPNPEGEDPNPEVADPNLEVEDPNPEVEVPNPEVEDPNPRRMSGRGITSVSQVTSQSHARIQRLPFSAAHFPTLRSAPTTGEDPEPNWAEFGPVFPPPPPWAAPKIPLFPGSPSPRTIFHRVSPSVQAQPSRAVYNP
ncbi:uncharacterized protein LOC116441443 isoform X2 [Corvus moneduloides]|uniref:uncharacterized protein LOC116441443 isoform X2 n=1 Tax=Corvus moneduloides TaxID=1196302 RepID=UPI001363A1EC|nr:uncharacterized protein LOC116441443 isoform X2 [Corvus moneduloides]